jgi:dTMP kinase
MFITFEGPEGGGKTTQIGRLATHLRELGQTVVTTRQPGGDPLGQRLRALMLDQQEIDIAPEAELLMMMADRAQSVQMVILPALNSGSVVVCDRYADSSLAYQGCGRGINTESVSALNVFATGGLTPDITFLLDIEPKAGLARQANINRMERMDAAFHDRVRAGYLEIARREPERFVVIDASQPADAVEQQIWEAYEAYHRHRP